MEQMTNAELIASLREAKNHFWTQPQIELYPMMEAAADALEAAEMRIAELEAQLPKEGEWNIRETASGDVEAKCPKCGFEMLVNQPGNGLLMVSELLYCPHCGSRMAKGEKE